MGRVIKVPNYFLQNINLSHYFIHISLILGKGPGSNETLKGQNQQDKFKIVEKLSMFRFCMVIIYQYSIKSTIHFH